jgi:hypothetical protein
VMACEETVNATTTCKLTSTASHAGLDEIVLTTAIQ